MAATDSNIEPYPTLGGKVRDRRRQLGLTLKDVSIRTGISVPFLSQIENGRHMPSLTTLFRLCPVLETTAEWLVGSAPTGPVSVVRADEGDRFPVTTDRAGAVRRQITAADTPFALSEYVVPPASSLGDFQSSSGWQILYVISGRLGVELQTGDGLQQHVLEPGDSLSYDAALEHRWHPVGEEKVRFLNVLGRGSEHS